MGPHRRAGMPESPVAEAAQGRQPRDWSIRRRLVVWVAGSAVGAAVLALPDSGNRVFSFSRTHGPSPLDLVGLVILLVVWVPVAAVLWRDRRHLRGTTARVAGVLAVTGAVALVVTIGGDLGAIYLGAVAMLLAAQLLALRVLATRR